MEIRKFKKGSKIFRQGEKASAVYMIKFGLVRVYKEEEGDDIEVARMSEGEMFGEMALIGNKYHSLNTEALADTELYIIRPEQLETKMKKADPLLKGLMLMLIDRMHKANDAFIALEKDKSHKVDVFRG